MHSFIHSQKQKAKQVGHAHEKLSMATKLLQHHRPLMTDRPPFFFFPIQTVWLRRQNIMVGLFQTTHKRKRIHYIDPVHSVQNQLGSRSICIISYANELNQSLNNMRAPPGWTTAIATISELLICCCLPWIVFNHASPAPTDTIICALSSACMCSFRLCCFPYPSPFSLPMFFFG